MQTRGRQFPKEVILTAIRWYLTYPLSYRQVEELLAERGVRVDHATIYRWTIRYAPTLHGQLMRRHRRVGDSWRMAPVALLVPSGGQNRQNRRFLPVPDSGRADRTTFPSAGRSSLWRTKGRHGRRLLR